mmetsp:Transcript_44967/g.143184  ORF Transcript_44967/g.143184 Transcript_44967/m.143184 type:complete len:182 (-) Transcript_44967:192-737(-)
MVAGARRARGSHWGSRAVGLHACHPLAVLGMFFALPLWAGLMVEPLRNGGGGPHRRAAGAQLRGGPAPELAPESPGLETHPLLRTLVDEEDGSVVLSLRVRRAPPERRELHNSLSLGGGALGYSEAAGTLQGLTDGGDSGYINPGGLFADDSAWTAWHYCQGGFVNLINLKIDENAGTDDR